jgi:uncharacterized protein (TIGR01777 family)
VGSEHATPLGALDGVDAVVHLAGESIASGRWTPERKRKIHESRAKGTRVLAEGLAALPHPPRVLVSASAIGIYGDRGDEQLDESSPRGAGFLADVCNAWEAASRAASDLGMRVVHLRFGVVSADRPCAREATAVPLPGSAGQSLGRAVRAGSASTTSSARSITRSSATTRRRGERVAPSPVRNRELAAASGRALHRPAIVPVPAVLRYNRPGRRRAAAVERVSCRCDSARAAIASARRTSTPPRPHVLGS